MWYIEETTLPDVNTGKPKLVYLICKDNKIITRRQTLVGAQKFLNKNPA